MNKFVTIFRKTYPLQWTMALMMLVINWLTSFTFPPILIITSFFTSFVSEAFMYIFNKNQ